MNRKNLSIIEIINIAGSVASISGFSIFSFILYFPNENLPKLFILLISSLIGSLLSIAVITVFIELHIYIYKNNKFLITTNLKILYFCIFISFILFFGSGFIATIWSLIFTFWQMKI